jgi:hypothetical protein
MSTIKTDNITNVAGTKTVPTDTVVAGSAKAWVNFNGIGTVAINDSFNVSSITDINVGRFNVNFTNALSNTNYSFAGSGIGDIPTAMCAVSQDSTSVTKTTSILAVKTSNENGAALDMNGISVIVFSK